MSPVFSMKVSLRHQSRLRAAPAPAQLADVGVTRFTARDAVRYAVITYLAQAEALPSVTLGSRSAGAWLQVDLPAHLHSGLEARAAAEGRSKASIVRAAIDLCFPPPMLPQPQHVERLAGLSPAAQRRSLREALAGGMAPPAFASLS